MANQRKYKIGDKINDWEIIDFIHGELEPYTCKCKCGIIRKKSAHTINSTKQCRACRISPPNMKHFQGEKLDTGFGFITLNKHIKRSMWEATCFCNKKFIFILDKAKSGSNKGKYHSCGCLFISNKIKYATLKIGLKHKHLKVTGVHGLVNRKIYLTLKCKCGKIITRPNGKEFYDNSCGCKQFEGRKSEDCNFSKISKDEVYSIRELYATNLYTQKDLGTMFSLTVSHIKNILNHKVWKNI